MWSVSSDIGWCRNNESGTVCYKTNQRQTLEVKNIIIESKNAVDRRIGIAKKEIRYLEDSLGMKYKARKR